MTHWRKLKAKRVFQAITDSDKVTAAIPFCLIVIINNVITILLI
jgi:hypothetical protein